MPGEVPKGWRSVRLGTLAREISEKNRIREAVPVLSLTKHRGFVPSAEYFSKMVHSKDTEGYKIVRRGQFAYATIHLDEGSIDVLRTHDAGLISPMYTVFEVLSDDVDAEFALRSLKHSALSGRFEPYSNGGVNRRKSISFHDLATSKFVLPPYAEQRAIMDVVRSVETVMVKTTELITAIRATKHATMRDLLTLGVRRQKAKLKKLPARWVLGRVAEGVEAIPADWNLVTLTSVAKLESGHTPSRSDPSYWGKDIPWLSLGDTDALDALTVTDTAEKVSHKGLANSSARLLPVDTVIFSRTATVGKATRLATPMATSQDFANWICGLEMDPRYLVQVFRHMQREWQRLQEGSTHQTIYMPVFQKLQVLKPPLPEQVKIADIGDAFDMRIAAERAELTRLTECRAALAQELLSGRVRLPEAMIARHRDKPGKAA